MSPFVEAASRTGRLVLMVFAVAGALVTSGGCGRSIGDGCQSSADCDPSGGTRTCDLSQPGGYCIVEGCDARSCPEDSFCVRFFPELFLDAGMSSCMLPEVTGAPACAVDEVCVPAGKTGMGVCARREWEKRACVQNCGDNGDCRSGYVCRPTGEDGTLPLTLTPNGKPKFCAPAPEV